VDGTSAISPILPSRLLMPVPPSVSADAPDAGGHGTATHDPASGAPAPAAGRLIVVHGPGVTDGAVPAEGVPVAATAVEAGAVDAAVVARLARTLRLGADADGATRAGAHGVPLPASHPPPGTPGAPFLPGVNESALAAWIAASGGAVALPAAAPPPSHRTGVGRRPGSPEDDSDDGDRDDGDSQGDGASSGPPSGRDEGEAEASPSSHH
jgi:hypothetical protein